MDYYSNLNIKLLDADIQKSASDFNCGNVFIDNFLKSKEAIDESFGKTYVWLEDDNKSIIGFYNLSTGCIDMLDGEIRFKMGG